MKELHNLVNIIPVIAKADTLTQAEIRRLKTRVSGVCVREGGLKVIHCFLDAVQVMQEIMDNNIRIYSGEIDEEEDSPEIKELRVMGVVCSIGAWK